MRSVLHTIWHTGNGSKMTAGPFTESRKESTFIAPVGFYVTRRDNGAHGGCCTLLRGKGWCTTRCAPLPTHWAVHNNVAPTGAKHSGATVKHSRAISRTQPISYLLANVLGGGAFKAQAPPAL